MHAEKKALWYYGIYFMSLFLNTDGLELNHLLIHADDNLLGKIIDSLLGYSKQ